MSAHAGGGAADLGQRDPMDGFRSQLDAFDAAIIALLGKRFDVVRDVARHKASVDMPVMQPGRVEQVLERNRSLAVDHELSPDLVQAIWALIIDEACRVEDEIIDSLTGDDAS